MPDIRQPPGSKSRANVQEGLPRNLGELILLHLCSNRHRVRSGIRSQTRPGTVIGSAEEAEVSVKQRKQSAGGTGSEGNEVNGTAM